MAVPAVEMLGRGSGWGIPLTSNTLAATLGGIGDKLAVAHGALVLQEYRRI